MIGLLGAIACVCVFTYILYFAVRRKPPFLIRSTIGIIGHIVVLSVIFAAAYLLDYPLLGYLGIIFFLGTLYDMYHYFMSKQMKKEVKKHE